MAQSEKTAAETAIESAEHIPGWGSGAGARILFAIAVAFSVFQLWTSAYSPLPSQVVRSVHVGFLLLLLFGLYANAATDAARRTVFWLAAVVAFALSLYHWIFYEDLLIRAGEPSHTDIVIGVLAVGLVFWAGKKMMGWTLPLICLIFLAYGLFGQYLPHPFNHRGYDFEQVVEVLFLGTEGIYGTPIYVSSSYIFLFILFGAFLERAGMIQLFNDIAMGTVGASRGGPAKVSVISSALMGTINGSGVANVVTTGAFTIPLMKRSGFRPAFAGGVEAVASMGGQIMPPVMGAVAFIMAETLGLPYVEIVKAAIVPAILYFITVFVMVDLEARRLRMKGLNKSEMPSALEAIRRRWFLILPLAALVWLLFSGYTPLFAGTVGLSLTALIILGVPVSGGLSMPLRVLFWIALGVMSAAAFGTTFNIFGYALRGITLIILLVALLVAINFAVRGGRETLSLCLESLAEGAKNALPVGIACALVGVIIGILALTGAGSTFARVIVSVGENSLFFSLVLTMLACLVLGMGIPTIPNYIITSSIAGPALLHLEVPLLVSHMFVFYFGIMADLTPPVALAAFAAAPIARESGMKIGMQAIRIAVAGFAVPFMAVYEPVIMLQEGGPLTEKYGFWLAFAYMLVKALLSILLWGAAAIGHLRTPLQLWERIWAFVAIALMLATYPYSDELGFAACAAFLIWHFWRSRPSVVASSG
ncbi:TRAP transporter permease [Brucella intermedia]|uniref:TRAP transporter 4TM/12TM fusion protein n=4 Tax=Brucella intermedia TaxID=94625 RepID=A0ABR6ATZ4_9HYPH|nr:MULTISPECIES: TRAP transporter permease [Brucella/Ochrobactrum group]PJR87605.1 C4-dicarboxylate ABC transporter [Ochrobactrum sp. 721/2009]PJT13599.1 C4-dicarboxylate ABC transporter [Ochrobactrum sp. 720/2009]PJT18316.1 C4-dicarboxylate ABC transporter [Ochrobactrum sp. 715/2009]PJT27789.1 C4-dicarboxylate ABC transporter [Ochrobactrum sp. 30A/1000/2015]PJT28495.1 C4-dicarboxylate ABC transporter [Ochrobactrum sp. 695/2009]PJT33664.1 C4-dicarboxylate ABC transporter [Ochrobactrum sp. 689